MISSQRFLNSQRLLLFFIIHISQWLLIYPCYNNCNGRGTCDVYDRCNCWPGYDNAPDCSRRTCPKGIAYSAKAEKINNNNNNNNNDYIIPNPHMLYECSNRGICNTRTGQCECEAGWTGDACQQSKYYI